jgi:ABC-type sugar transport system permease subunit
LGYHTMFYLAGLAAIPKELFEAARVDGANEWTLFWHITLPRLRPILLVLVVLRFGTAMAVIDEYLILGGFNRALPTYTWTVYMWDEAFQIGDWFQGYAAAIGWIGAAAMLACSGCSGQGISAWLPASYFGRGQMRFHGHAHDGSRSEHWCAMSCWLDSCW